jgi:hypothetical protein
MTVELIVGALVVMMEEDESSPEAPRSDLDEVLAARCAAL